MNAELHDLGTPPGWGASSIARALLVLLCLVALLLAVLVLVSPTVWPSLQELRVTQLLTGREAGPLAFGPADYVELEAADCQGHCRGYRVRLFGDGALRAVESGFTCVQGVRETRLSAAQAQRLMAALYVASQPLARPRPWTGAVVVAWIRFSHAGRQVAHDYAVLPSPGEHRALGQALTALEQVALAPDWQPQLDKAHNAYCTRPDSSRRPVDSASTGPVSP